MPDPLAVLGISVAEAAPAPLSAAGELAVACWNFCDGWHPERWPIFDALHAVDDWPQMAELMQAIRDATKAQHDHKPA